VKEFQLEAKDVLLNKPHAGFLKQLPIGKDFSRRKSTFLVCFVIFVCYLPLSGSLKYGDGSQPACGLFSKTSLASS